MGAGIRGPCVRPQHKAVYWAGVVVGVCSLWSTAQPSQNKKRKAKRQNTRNRRKGK